jgi:general secretion pathway protein A
MRDEQGREFHATLTALEPDAATFAVAGETRTVALGALAAQWSGHYRLLWRAPPAVQGTIRPGDRGPAVAWLSGQLAQLQGKALETAGDAVFDEAMLRRVKQFQFARGLIPDGNVGSQTVIRLVGETDQTAPKLVRARGEK